MKILHRCWGDIVAVVLFALIAFAYFFPADVEGRILYRHDSSAGKGAGVEMSQYMERTGERTRWTNALFGGMPTYQMAPSYDSGTALSSLSRVYHLWLPENVWYVFVYLLGFYILLRTLRCRPPLAVMGSIVWAFSSYFFVIIAAGHIWKVVALAYLPPMIAGILLAYRGRYAWGFVVTALFVALEVNANHVQMTYYYLFIVLLLVVGILIHAIRKRLLPSFAKATAVCLVAAALGVCANLPNLYHTWQYSKESMRGASELTTENSEEQTPSGLTRSYITSWSYGIDETLTLLVPNAKGGASVPIADNATAMTKADPTYRSLYQYLTTYWGEQPSTSGPVYVGAFVMMLFILGLFIVKGHIKWALLAATVLSVLLSWGHNFQWLTDLFIDHVPMYAQFRTVSSILVIAEFTIPLLAALALKEMVEHPEVMKGRMKYFVISLVLTAGVAAAVAVVPKMFFPSFIPSAEMEALERGISPDYLPAIVKNLTEMRVAVLTADCRRTLLIVLIGALFVFLFLKKKLSATAMVVLVAALCLFDMWQVNKRYLNDDMFVTRNVREQPQAMTDADRQILLDESLDYRVLNLATNTFNENETSYYHKSIGGYHAAKLRRYDDIIKRYYGTEMRRLKDVVVSANGDLQLVAGDSIFPVLNMLNAKYFIIPLVDNKTVAIQNPHANGNAWFVDKISYVDDANAEIDAIGHIDLKHEAVADRRFADVLGEAEVHEGEAYVEITSYDANELHYSVRSDDGGIVVFSEVYYPGWTATVDGEAVPVGRANYVLRALRVEPGEHDIVLTFKPKSVKVTDGVAYASLSIMFLAMLGCLFVEWKRAKNGTRNKPSDTAKG